MINQLKKLFDATEVSFTPKQKAYINRIFAQKGPVLIRIGVGKTTKFLAPHEYEEIIGEIKKFTGGN